jgi:hypothetical protein
MLPVGFEPAFLASEWPQTYVLDRAATGTGTTPDTYLLNTLLLQVVIAAFLHCTVITGVFFIKI